MSNSREEAFARVDAALERYEQSKGQDLVERCRLWHAYIEVAGTELFAMPPRHFIGRCDICNYKICSS